MLCDITKKLVASQNTVKDSSALGDKTDQPQVQRNNLKVSKWALEESLLPSSYRALVSESQTEASKDVKVRTVTGKEWYPLTWGGAIWEVPTEVKNFEPSDSPGFILLEEIVSPLSAENALPLTSLEILPFSTID